MTKDYLLDFGRQYKIDKQKSVIFLYTNYEQPQKEIIKTIPFTIAFKTTKYLGIN